MHSPDCAAVTDQRKPLRGMNRFICINLLRSGWLRPFGAEKLKFRASASFASASHAAKKN